MLVRHAMLMLMLALALLIEQCAWALTITLADQAAIGHDRVLLGDIAVIEGADAEADKLRAIYLCPAPAIGHSRAIPATLLSVWIGQQGVASGSFTLTGSPRVTVQRVAATQPIQPGATTTSMLAITIPATVVVAGDTITLGEIAAITGDAPAVARAQAITLGGAPALGLSRAFSAGAIRARLAQSGIEAATCVLTCPPVVTVSRQAQLVRGDAIVQMALAAARERIGAGGDAVVLSPVGTMPNIQLPPAEVTWECLSRDGATGSTISVNVTARQRGKPCWQGLVTFRAERYALVLVAKEAIAKDAPLTESMVMLERRDIAALATTPLRALTEVMGRRATTPISAGAILTPYLARPIPTICRNERVWVTASIGAMTIRMQVIALEDGGEGESIRVQNPTTGKEFTARVTDAGTLSLAL